MVDLWLALAMYLSAITVLAYALVVARNKNPLALAGYVAGMMLLALSAPVLAPYAGVVSTVKPTEKTITVGLGEPIRLEDFVVTIASYNVTCYVEYRNVAYETPKGYKWVVIRLVVENKGGEAESPELTRFKLYTGEGSVYNPVLPWEVGSPANATNATVVKCGKLWVDGVYEAIGPGEKVEGCMVFSVLSSEHPYKLSFSRSSTTVVVLLQLQS